MSDLPSNPYAEGPANYLEDLHFSGKSHLAYEISATLALAYEQRTASLLHALEISLRAQGLGLDSDALQKQIVARLGLDGGSDD